MARRAARPTRRPSDPSPADAASRRRRDLPYCGIWCNLIVRVNWFLSTEDRGTDIPRILLLFPFIPQRRTKSPRACHWLQKLSFTSLIWSSKCIQQAHQQFVLQRFVAYNVWDELHFVSEDGEFFSRWQSIQRRVNAYIPSAILRWTRVRMKVVLFCLKTSVPPRWLPRHFFSTVSWCVVIRRKTPE